MKWKEMVKPEDLKAFMEAARKLGAVKVETWKYDEEDVRAGRQRAPDSEFRWWMSASSGGCGSPGCQCSPGLWISASQGNEGAVAHFRDHWNWLRFQRLLKMEAYSPP
jgi:hypothetical protein